MWRKGGRYRQATSDPRKMKIERFQLHLIVYQRHSVINVVSSS